MELARYLSHLVLRCVMISPLDPSDSRTLMLGYIGPDGSDDDKAGEREGGFSLLFSFLDARRAVPRACINMPI